MLLWLLLLSLEGQNVLNAASSMDLKTMQALIAEGEGVNPVNQAGETPLMLAAKTGYADMVSLLLQNQAQTEAVSFQGETAMMYAVRQGRLEVIRLLVAAQSPVSTRNGAGDSPLFLAIARRDYAAARILVEAGAKLTNTNRANESPLFKAVLFNDLPMIRLLVNAGADVGKGRRADARTSPLKLAKTLNNRSAIAILEGGPTDISGQGLDAALTGGNAEALKDLWSNQKDYRNLHGATALMIAARFGDKNMVSALIEAGADVNEIDEAGRTALTEAVRYGRIGVAVLLLSKGADGNVLTKEGASPLSIAFLNRDITSLNFLVGYNSLAITRDKAGNVVKLPFKRVRTDLIGEAVKNHQPRYADSPYAIPGVPVPIKAVSSDGPGSTPPTITKQKDVIYPDKGSRAPSTGVVQVRAVIGQDGQIRSLGVEKAMAAGRWGFEYGALKAMSSWKFAPGKQDGKAVTMSHVFEVSVFRDN